MRTIFALFTLAATALAQLSTQQKVDDFRSVVALFNKQYAPYEWKRDAIGFDLLKASPWEERIRATRDDIEYFEIMVQYVASLRDAHAAYAMPSNFGASLGFRADFYDGRAIIDEVLVANSQVRVGDELVSVDGTTIAEWLPYADRFVTGANPDARRRMALQLISQRAQATYPRAHEVPAASKVVIRRGTEEPQELTINWVRSGIALTSVTPLPELQRKRIATTSREEETLFLDQPWFQPIAPLLMAKLPEAVRGRGQRPPLFTLPTGFQLRTGTAATDSFVTGTFEAQGRRLGLLRIPNMFPGTLTGAITNADINRAVAQMQQEITFLEANTEGLIVDVMRNPGGLVIYVDLLAQALIPGRFRVLGFEIRATLAWINRARSSLTLARLLGAPAWQIQQLEGIVRDLESAYREQRGRTGAIALGTTTGLDDVGNTGAYTKPMILLVDGFSASGGDALPAILQDAGRALIVGQRTSGAGGNVATFSAGYYTEASVSVTQSLMNRATDIRTPDLPAAPYVENIGVRPDRELNFMTVENLQQNGRPFLDAAVNILIDHIRNGSPYVAKP